MERIVCPVEGFDDFVVLFPQPLLIRHVEAYSRGSRKAGAEFGPGVSAGVQWFSGIIELCEFENKPEGDPMDWPIELFNFIVDDIYLALFQGAINPKKKTSSKPPTTPKEKK